MKVAIFGPHEVDILSFFEEKVKIRFGKYLDPVLINALMVR